METKAKLTSKPLATEKLCKQFFRREWNDKKHLVHCQTVQDACIRMASGTNLDQHVFIIAAWIHDLGKLDDKAKHEQESLKYLDKFLHEYPEYERYYAELVDCIIHHRTTGTPVTNYGKVFKVADKVGLLDKRWIAYKKKKVINNEK
jgi:HD superfamily phosphodiesterase